MKYFIINTITRAVVSEVPTTKMKAGIGIPQPPPNVGGHLIVVQAEDATGVPAELAKLYLAMDSGTSPKIQPFFSDFKPK